MTKIPTKHQDYENTHISIDRGYGSRITPFLRT